MNEKSKERKNYSNTKTRTSFVSKKGYFSHFFVSKNVSFKLKSRSWKVYIDCNYDGSNCITLLLLWVRFPRGQLQPTNPPDN